MIIVMKINIKTNSCKLLSDMHTPVSLYLKIRDLYTESALLESTEYRTPESSFSYIGFCTIARFKVENNNIIEEYPNSVKQITTISQGENIFKCFERFCGSFSISENKTEGSIGQIKESNPTGINGLFGFTSYDSVSHIEPVVFGEKDSAYKNIPDMNYIYYRYVIVMNMYNNEMFLLENLIDGETSEIEKILVDIENNNFDIFGFSLIGEKSSNMTDEEYLRIVSEGIRHCKRGDVFQIVLARRFRQEFLGDDFNVYRTLRSVNPSPYLFYFDFGSYRIFGSSPETHFRINGKEAYIDPIAGTFKRTGDRKSLRMNSSHIQKYRMPSSA